MTGIRLGVGCERQSKVLIFGLARKPLLLFRHRGGVRTEKGKSIESIVEYAIIQFSRLRLVDDLPRLVEALQGKGVVGEIDRTKPHDPVQGAAPCLVISAAFSYCPCSAYTMPKLPYAPISRG